MDPAVGSDGKLHPPQPEVNRDLQHSPSRMCWPKDQSALSYISSFNFLASNTVPVFKIGPPEEERIHHLTHLNLHRLETQMEENEDVDDIDDITIAPVPGFVNNLDDVISIADPDDGSLDDLEPDSSKGKTVEETAVRKESTVTRSH